MSRLWWFYDRTVWHSDEYSLNLFVSVLFVLLCSFSEEFLPVLRNDEHNHNCRDPQLWKKSFVWAEGMNMYVRTFVEFGTFAASKRSRRLQTNYPNRNCDFFMRFSRPSILKPSSEAEKKELKNRHSTCRRRNLLLSVCMFKFQKKLVVASFKELNIHNKKSTTTQS